MQIAEDIYLVSNVSPNVYILSAPSGLTLIDSGLPLQARKILSALSELGYPDKRLERILITHADFDHVGSLAAVKSAAGASIAANPIEARAIETGRPSREIGTNRLMRAAMSRLTAFTGQKPARVDVQLSDGEVLPLLGGLRVIYTPGHTPGHISLWSPSRRILFAGDSISVRNGRLRENTHFVWDPALMKVSFREQRELNPVLVCAGHGWTDKGFDHEVFDG